MKPPVPSRLWLVRGFLLLAAVIATGCHSGLLMSSWLNSVATQRGKPDWFTLPMAHFEELPGNLSVTNDSSTLYLHWTAQHGDLSTRLAQTGMTVWLIDPQDKSQQLGIHYPLGSDGAASRPGHFLPDAELAPEVVYGLLHFQTDEFEVLLGGADDSTVKRGAEAAQIGVRVLITDKLDGTFEYELKLVFGAAVPWLKPGARLRLEIEAPAVERARSDRPTDQRGFPGIRRRERGPVGPPGDSDRRAASSSFRPIHLQMTVQLSIGPAEKSE